MKHRVRLTQTWDGRPAEPEEQVELWFALSEQGLRIGVDAPWHGDPAPPQRPGPTDRLWEHEVVEVFIAGPEGAERPYTEIEMGPHGHYLVLQLRGVRAVHRTLLPLTYLAGRRGERWRGVALLAPDLLPEPVAYNAYAIHGTGPDRRYLAAHPVPGETPDFHRLDCFAAWPG